MIQPIFGISIFGRSIAVVAVAQALAQALAQVLAQVLAQALAQALFQVQAPLNLLKI